MNAAPRIDRPEPGFYQTRLVKGGPLIPARIWIDDTIPERPPVMLAEVNGREADPYRVWPSLAGNVISKAEFDHLTRVSEWARTAAPHAPEANPMQAIDLSKQPVFTPRRTA